MKTLTLIYQCKLEHQLSETGTTGGVYKCQECKIAKNKNYKNTYHRTEKYKEYLKSYRRTEVGKMHLKNGFVRHQFGANREAAILRDGEKCVNCSMSRAEHREIYGRDITVDHIDGNGRKTEKAQKNNSLDNLQTLCMKCHGSKDALRRWHGGIS